MKRHILILFCVAITVLGLTALTSRKVVPYEVLVTAYTCEPTRRNPMHPCGPLRWGGNVNSQGMACPVMWRDRIMKVPGYGWLRCDDTLAQEYIYGLPHIDIRVSTVNEALQIGVQRMVIYAADLAPPAPPVPPAPVAAIDKTTTNGAQANNEVANTPVASDNNENLFIRSEPEVATTIQEQAAPAPPAANDLSPELREQINNIKSSIYTVVANDTLYHIALKNNTTVDLLRRLNNLTGDLLIIGQQLEVPTEGQTVAVTAPAPTPPPPPQSAPEPVTAPAPEPAPSQLTHIVKQGEWMYGIARQYGISPNLLLRVNNLNNPNRINVGQELIIPQR